MKTTQEPLFSNGTEFTTWTANNCGRCIKASKFNEKKDTWSAFKCTIDRDIQMQAAGCNEVNQQTFDIVQNPVCSKIQTERKPTKKREIKNQLNLFA